VPPTSVAPSTVGPTTIAAATGPSIPAPVVTMTLQKIVPLDSAIIVYISMDIEDRDPSLVSIMPVDVYLIDSQGQKIDLIGGYTWQPYEHPAGSLFEFRSASKPADGTLTIVVENAVSYYMPLNVDVPQATPEELSFTFDAGTNPQRGQTWELNNEFKIGRYPLKVTSARAVIWDDFETSNFLDGSQGYEFGYQFTVESDPSIKIDVEMDIMSEKYNCWSMFDTIPPKATSPLLHTQLCRGEFPKGTVKTTIWELAVLLENTWQTTWTP
ncbi:MAG TPA: hypothetical protein VHP14_19465, partial [Anaerolineales bacterium]|nr:hypothetical protein [Anaerolineales bacterium]